MTDKTNALLRSLFAVDENGQTFLRVTTAEPEGELKNAVSSQSNRTLETLLSNCIVLDADGNPAIRLAPVEFGTTFEEADKKRRAKMLADKKAREAAAQKEREEAEKAAKQK